MNANLFLKKAALLLLFTGMFIMCKPDNEPENPSDDSTENTQWKITSGRVNTFKKFSFQYGRMDIYTKFPKTANGLWPAIWLMGTDYNGYSSDGTRIANPQSNWPSCGEIDIMEMGKKEGIIQGTQERFLSRGTHWGAVMPNYSHPSYCIDDNYPVGLQDGFHLFTFTWNEMSIKMYIDPSLDENLELLPGNTPYYEIKIDAFNGDYPVGNYFHKPYFVILNLAVGGDFSQIYEIDNVTALNQANQYEADMYIDFIRVFDDTKELVWQDDFDGNTLDASKWNVEENDYGGGNHELQTYTKNNVSIDIEPKTGKHCLKLTAKKIMQPIE